MSEQPSGWQPIETAPKDGTEILLAAHIPSVGWQIVAGGWIVGDNEFWMWGGRDHQPSHWMPLPEPPQ